MFLKHRAHRSLIALALPCVWVLSLAVLGAVTGDALAAPDHSAYAGSNSCRSCHQDHYASWHRTYHRTMTQEATDTSVVGNFNGEPVTYWGQTIRPIKRDGQFRFEYLDDAGRMVGYAVIKRTVGSHRYQQYLAQAPTSGDNYIRMQLLWHIGDARWVHMNGAFLYSDDQTPNQHVSTWNSNCIFCHNTGPQPNIQNYEALLGKQLRGRLVNFLEEARFESEVAELGIACEACHGPGAAHADDMRNPFKRYWHAFNSAAPVDHIVYPEKLSPERSSQVCGQCHAQRVPARTDLVQTWLDTGPTYRPGDDLLDHVTLVSPQTPGSRSKPDLYRLRFWEDGTPRLSAYEYTGLRMSDCHTDAAGTERQASCIGCHEAHGGQPEGMITEANRRGESCLDCHQQIAAAPAQHTRHAPDSAGSDCVSCHMPRVVYGVMAIHRSHNIERPDPVGHAAQNRPDACTSCHLDKSATWAGAQVARWPAAAVPQDGGRQPEWLRQLLGGDPVQRAIAAEAAGRPGVDIDDPRWMVPPLLASLSDDYPAVRRFAAHSLRALDARLSLGLTKPLAGFDFIGPEPQRRQAEKQAFTAWRAAHEPGSAQPAWLSGAVVDPVVLAALRKRASAQAQRIEIGE